MDKLIRKTWAFVSVEKDGTEEIIFLDTAHGEMAMIGTDAETAHSMAMHAQECADNYGWRIRLIEFSDRRHIREFIPMKRDMDGKH